MPVRVWDLDKMYYPDVIFLVTSSVIDRRNRMPRNALCDLTFGFQSFGNKPKCASALLGCRLSPCFSANLHLDAEKAVCYFSSELWKPCPYNLPLSFSVFY